MRGARRKEVMRREREWMRMKLWLGIEAFGAEGSQCRIVLMYG
jgi:hypothetical protein